LSFKFVVVVVTMIGKCCRRSFSSGNSNRLARRAVPAKCRSVGVVKTRCNRKRLPLFCYEEIYLFDQLRYIRNTNPVNCIRKLSLHILDIYLTISRGRYDEWQTRL